MPRARYLVALATSLLLVLVGCGSVIGGVRGNAGASPTAMGSPTAVATPTVSFAPTPPGPLANPCGPPPGAGPGVKMGDLLVGVGPTNLNYPSHKLPDNLPLAPYQLSDFEGSTLPRIPLVNPALTGPGGFFFTICNTSKTVTHRLASVDALVAAFTPYAGDLNTWLFCDGSYIPAGGGVGGCGGGYETYANLTATFPASAGTGASVPATYTDVRDDVRAPTPPLAMNIPPLHYGLLVVHVVAPTVPGYYSFAFRLHVDDSVTPYVADDESLLLDPQARRWSGDACQTPAMKAQILATSTHYYICPPA